MLFTSIEFLAGFLPIVLAGFFWLGRERSSRWLLPWLVAASFFFYGWWNTADLVVFAWSVAANYLLYRGIRKHENIGALLLGVGLVGNLSLLGWFKYRTFLMSDILGVQIFGSQRVLDLPIGISFFTFQQIAWLVDSKRNREVEASWLEYAGFVAFFPQLIAGPIVHHRELVPQLKVPQLRRRRPALLAAGLSLFGLGLIKKLVVADSLAGPASLAFNATDRLGVIAPIAAWTGLLSYAGQIYFDFSGYSDMALGLGLMFGIRLPANFLSPYSAANVGDFWRRWHITLSYFLRDYVYIPLGGSRCSRARHYANLIGTMAVGGIWHGAGHTFLLWGLLHGVLLVAADAWQKVGSATRRRFGWWPAIPQPVAVGATLTLVVLAWVPFRATTLSGVGRMYASLLPAISVASPTVIEGVNNPARPFTPYGMGRKQLAWAMAVLVGCIVLPSTMQLFRRPLRGRWHEGDSAAGRVFSWQPSVAWAGITAVCLAWGVLQSLSVAPTPFLYFQF
jgi:D-alanyl-lipoteichoic acid acyltransferase DltB (MBOAT superfamily)